MLELFSIEEPHSNVYDIKKRPANFHTVINNGKPLNLVNLNAHARTNEQIHLSERAIRIPRRGHYGVYKPGPTTQSMIVNFFYATKVAENWNITQKELSPQITEAELQ